MEKGFGDDLSSSSSDGEKDEDDDGLRNSIKRINDLYNHSHKQKGYSQPLDHWVAVGVWIKIPGEMPPTAKAYNMSDEIPTQNPNPRFSDPVYDTSYGPAPNKVFRDGLLGRDEIGKRAGESVKRKKMDGGSGSEVAATIQSWERGL
ncbi:basic helix-loop-helix (bHLH) DNA-bindingsuperfamily protein [Striga asiatica]|uniref:Basic helix-loop-helix (BHLH) DNA-bindingsuperfamily protein n=1 Tax=Striga asiatica TaxID=4170 RepID=A0A5A7PC99_STRAF|nr:basic helix-loop-helix (bHLH) DNA-bindingsuperfamily protein [Striga asiatica]